MTTLNNTKKSAPLAIGLSLAFAVALTGLAEDAAASIVTAGSSIANGTYVSSNTSGSFDISGALGGNTAVSGWVGATFADDGDGFQYNGGNYDGDYYSGSSRYCCGFSSCYNYYYYGYSKSYYVNPYEAATLNIGSSSESSASNYSSSSEYRGSNSYWYGNTNYATYYYNYYSGYDGIFSINMYLDAAALADLNDNGVLGFGLAAYGDFVVTGITLTANLVQDVAVQNLRVANVPEPGSLALLGLALGGLGFTRRSRRKNAAID